jgi:hypothetical protein
MDSRILRFDATPFEWYMLEDHSESHPMVFTIYFDTKGSISDELLKQAFWCAIERHPLLRSSTLVLDAWPRYAWECPSFAPEEKGEDDGVNLLHAPMQNTIDPFRGPLCRLRIHRLADPAMEPQERWIIAVDFHHAVADGIGALEFCSDVFQIYENLIAQSADREQDSSATNGRDRFKDIDINLVSERGVLDRSIPHPVSRGTALRFLAWEAARFIFALPVRLSSIDHQTKSDLAPPSNDARDSVRELVTWESFGLSGLEISPEITKVLRQYAQRSGGTLNHLLLAATLCALARGRPGFLGRLRTWVTVLPVNMRRLTPRRTPCNNGIGYAFLRRTRSDCLDWKKNFQSIQSEIKAIQEWKLAGLFLDVLAHLQRVPRWIAKFVLRRSQPGSFVWSYLGDPMRRFPDRLREHNGSFILGDVILEGLAAAPPTRAGTELAVLATLWRDSIRLYFRFDERAISKQQSAWIRQLISEELVSIAETIRISQDNP